MVCTECKWYELECQTKYPKLKVEYAAKCKSFEEIPKVYTPETPADAAAILKAMKADPATKVAGEAFNKSVDETLQQINNLNMDNRQGKSEEELASRPIEAPHITCSICGKEAGACMHTNLGGMVEMQKSESVPLKDLDKVAMINSADYHAVITMLEKSLADLSIVDSAIAFKAIDKLQGQIQKRMIHYFRGKMISGEHEATVSYKQLAHKSPIGLANSIINGTELKIK